MRYLQLEEITEADRCIEEAVKEALKSTCEKSKRGVVIVKDGQIIGRGCNNPPTEMKCVPSICYSICNQYAIHGEQNAIFDALKAGNDISGSRMYHIKVKEGEARTSEGPSCAQCSKFVLQSGISEFVLKHDKGYGLYDAREFHELSLKAIRR